MFSPTTIASSTKIPTTKIIPNNEITFSVIPAKFAMINMPAKENGIPIETQKESRRLRKKPSVITTRSKPIRPFLPTILTSV
jgi:hypothetical protein